MHSGCDKLARTSLSVNALLDRVMMCGTDSSVVEAGLDTCTSRTRFITSLRFDGHFPGEPGSASSATLPQGSVSCSNENVGQCPT